MCRKIISLIICLLFSINLVYAASPSRTYTYTTGEIIDPSKVTTNEDNIFNYLNTGVDTFLDGSIVNADISTSAAIAYSKLNLGSSIISSDITNETIVSADIADGSIVNADISSSAAISDSKLAQITTASKVSSTAITGGVVLPSGALFYMITGSCPSGTTDVSSTYSNKFVRINATAGSTGGADTDSITLTTNELPAHTHTVGIWGQGALADSGNITGQATTNETQETSSSAGSGAAFSVDTVPAYVTAKACQVN